MVVHILDDYRNMKRFLQAYMVIIILFFFFLMAFGVLLRIDCVMAAVAHLSATCLIFIGWRVSFPVSAFSVFPHFPRQSLLISLAFPLPISPFSMRLISPSRILLLTYSIFSLTSRYAPPLLRFSFLSEFSLYLCHLSSFSSLYYPFFLPSGSVCFFNGG